MNRGRAAPSARSDSSEMDAEGTGNVLLDMNNYCYSPPIVYVGKTSTNVRLTVSTESEITRLKRQLRIMEGERHAYDFQTREQIRKQE